MYELFSYWLNIEFERATQPFDKKIIIKQKYIGNSELYLHNPELFVCLFLNLNSIILILFSMKHRTMLVTCLLEVLIH